MMMMMMMMGNIGRVKLSYNPGNNKIKDTFEHSYLYALTDSVKLNKTNGVLVNNFILSSWER